MFLKVFLFGFLALSWQSYADCIINPVVEKTKVHYKNKYVCSFTEFVQKYNSSNSLPSDEPLSAYIFRALEASDGFYRSRDSEWKKKMVFLIKEAVRDGDGEKIWTNLLMTNNGEFLQVAYNEGLDINFIPGRVDGQHTIPLNQALDNSDFESARKLIELGADLNIKHPMIKKASQPLIYAVSNPRTPVSLIKQIVSGTEDVTQSSPYSNKPAIYLVIESNARRYLDSDRERKQDGRPESEIIDIVQELFEAGEDPKRQFDGRSLSSLAFGFGYFRGLRLTFDLYSKNFKL